MTITALALFSGGLDSILSCRAIMALGIKVHAITFVSPFFGYSLLAEEARHVSKIKEKYGIDVSLHNVSESYLRMLRSPRHGYGRHFNPCVDCKILLISEARKMMPDFGASFLITGEVLGQRPMSQRQDTLRIIERDSGCEGLLLRPLCARNQKPTPMEEQGLVDRNKLYNFQGRTRTPQIELARAFAIQDYPSPAGGCALTDPIIGARIKQFFAAYPQVTANDMQLIQVGRQFELSGGGWLALGRKEKENDQLLQFVQPGDIVLKSVDRPGPAAILRHPGKGDPTLAASMVARYAKGGKEAKEPLTVQVKTDSDTVEVKASPLTEDIFSAWRR